MFKKFTNITQKKLLHFQKTAQKNLLHTMSGTADFVAHYSLDLSIPPWIDRRQYETQAEQRKFDATQMKSLIPKVESKCCGEREILQPLCTLKLKKHFFTKKLMDDIDSYKGYHILQETLDIQYLNSLVGHCDDTMQEGTPQLYIREFIVQSISNIEGRFVFQVAARAGEYTSEGVPLAKMLSKFFLVDASLEWFVYHYERTINQFNMLPQRSNAPQPKNFSKFYCAPGCLPKQRPKGKIGLPTFKLGGEVVAINWTGSGQENVRIPLPFAPNSNCL